MSDTETLRWCDTLPAGGRVRIDPTVLTAAQLAAASKSSSRPEITKAA